MDFASSCAFSPELDHAVCYPFSFTAALVNTRVTNYPTKVPTTLAWQSENICMISLPFSDIFPIFACLQKKIEAPSFSINND